MGTINKEQPLTYAHMVEYLKENGYIIDGILYTNPRGINFTEYEESKFDQIHDMLHFYTSLLWGFVQGPTLIDDIIDVIGNEIPDKSKREAIRLALNLYDKATYDFNETNKLQASNVKNMFECMSQIGKMVVLPDELVLSIADLHVEVYRTPFSKGVDKYILDLSNSEKLTVVNKLTIVAEEVIIQVLERVKQVA
jgi:hypothetical protein